MAETRAVSIDSPGYTIRFALIVCLICAALVAVPSVLLRPAQEASARLYREKNVLVAAGLATAREALSAAEIEAIFARRIEARLIDRRTGDLLAPDAGDARRFDSDSARNDAATGGAAPANRAGVRRLPDRAVVYFVRDGDAIEQIVIAVDGLGMWGTIRGFVALAPDANTVRGVTFYEHRETPGLGGEIANPDWLALWRGRATYDAAGSPALRIVKGPAGDPETDPLRVDGLSGATITGNAVTALVQYWLGEHGYRPFLERFRTGEFG